MSKYVVGYTPAASYAHAVADTLLFERHKKDDQEEVIIFRV